MFIKKDEDNPVANHLSRMENIPVDPIPINDSFVNEKLANINVSSARVSSPWFTYYANFIVGKVMPLMSAFFECFLLCYFI